MTGYAARRLSRCESLSLYGRHYNIRRWGIEGAPPLLLLHGGQDSSITFQFMVDAFAQDWAIVAPDFQGHGQSEWNSQGYWLHEMLGDLDAFLATVLNDRPVPVVGHSMGGNLVSLYAGLHPERITKFVSLDAFGPRPDQVPKSMGSALGRYITRLRTRRASVAYPSLAAMAERLRQTNPRLARDKAIFLAEHSSVRQVDGSYRWMCDPNYQGSFPTLPNFEDWRELWSRISAPVLWIVSSDRRFGLPGGISELVERRRGLIPSLAIEQIPETGHNLHHDEPVSVARLVEQFLA